MPEQHSYDEHVIDVRANTTAETIEVVLTTTTGWIQTMVILEADDASRLARVLVDAARSVVNASARRRHDDDLARLYGLTDDRP